MSGTCTCHALANVIVDRLDADGVDINHSHVVQTLIKLLQRKTSVDTEAVWPDEFNNCEHTILTKDEETKEWIAVKINSVESVPEFNPTGKHVLTYKLGHSKLTHCVFVRKQLKLHENAYDCVNSWGHIDPYPIVKENKSGNELWKVQTEWQRASQGMCAFK